MNYSLIYVDGNACYTQLLACLDYPASYLPAIGNQHSLDDRLSLFIDRNLGNVQSRLPQRHVAKEVAGCVFFP